MLLLAENFTLKVLTRLAHKVLGISNRRLRFSSDADIVRLTNARIIIKIKIHLAIPNNMHVISVKHFHKKAINDKI